MRDTIDVSRRSIVLGTGGVLVGGGALAAFTTQPATALTVSGLDVSPASKTLSPDGTVQGVSLSISLDYEYSASHKPTTVEVACFVAKGSDGAFDELDALSLAEPATSDSGTVSLAGDLTATDAFATADFDVAEGQTTSQTVAVKVVLTILRDGKRIGVADISDSATVTLTRESLTVSAQIAGSGSLNVVTS